MQLELTCPSEIGKINAKKCPRQGQGRRTRADEPVLNFLLRWCDFALGFSPQVRVLFVPVSTTRTQQFRWKSVCIISWMTLSLDLVNKCALNASLCAKR